MPSMLDRKYDAVLDKVIGEGGRIQIGRDGGTGVAKAALEWSIAHTRSEGCRWLRLDCLDRAPLRRLYESVGFELVDHVAPDGVPERGCRYRLDVTAR